MHGVCVGVCVSGCVIGCCILLGYSYTILDYTILDDTTLHYNILAMPVPVLVLLRPVSGSGLGPVRGSERGIESEREIENGSGREREGE